MMAIVDVSGLRVSPDNPDNLTMAPLKERARKRACVFRDTIVRAAVTDGVNLTEVGKSENFPLKRVERRLREELHNLWTAPVEDYARLQIAQLKMIAAPLEEKASEGHFPTIDRRLKVLDRLDRDRGFTKLAATTSAPREDVCAQLIAKLEQAARTPARGQ